jgi:hypothetical protein
MFNLGDVITHVPSLLPQLLCRGTHIMCVGMPIYVRCRWKQSQRFSVWYFCFYFREVKTQLNHSRSLAACVRMSCSMRAQKDRERKGIRVQDKTTRSECLVDMHSDAKYPVATATTITFTFWNCRILFLLSVKLAKVLQLAQSLHICSLNVKFRCVSWRSSCLKLRWYVPAEAAVLDRCLLFGGGSIYRLVSMTECVGIPVRASGDVLLHCVVDAILGALGLPDIGQIFPDSVPRWKGADSSVFTREAVSLLAFYCALESVLCYNSTLFL